MLPAETKPNKQAKVITTSKQASEEHLPPRAPPGPAKHCWSHHRSHSLGQQTRPAIVVFTPTTYSDAHFGETHLECLLAHLVVRTHSRRNTPRWAGNTNRDLQYNTKYMLLVTIPDKLS